MKYCLNSKRLAAGATVLLAAGICLSGLTAAPAQNKRDSVLRSLDSSSYLKSGALVMPKSAAVVDPRSNETINAAGKSAKALFTGHIQINRSSPPEAGIKLLQDILQRVRNVPQIAMNKPKFQADQNLLNVQQAAQGPTDYRLAIRPQAIATPPVLQPEVKKGSNVIAWGELPPTRLDSAVVASSSDADAGAVISGESALAGKKGFWERDGEPLSKSKNQKGKDAKVVATVAAGLPAEEQAANYGYGNAQGIWEREKAKAEAAVGKLSAESRQRLSNSASKLFNLAQGLEAAQQSVEVRTSAAANDDESKQRSAELASRSKRSYSQRFEKEKPGGQLRETQILADKLVISDFRAQPVQSYGAALGSGGGSRAGGGTCVRGNLLHAGAVPAPVSPMRASKEPYPAPLPAPMAAPRSGGAISNLAPAESFYADQVAPLRRNEQTSKRDSRLAEVALLPPNVVTGIPLVRLGCSESQAMQALTTLGGSERHTVNGWTVLIFRKPGTKSSAVQVYMRNGQVEALRIFDSALVGPDFGVKLGDELTSVKLRFGEPAFILSEPLSGSGQNYVYPISQVAFQLSRPARGAKPQVVSLLIFNVK